MKIYLPSVDSELSKQEQLAICDDMPTGSETILLVEDEPLVRSLTSTVLREQGYTVLEATNGEEALRMAQQNVGEIHLLLTDVVMPKMGGVELTKKFMPLFPSTGVLLMSGYNEEVAAWDNALADGVGFLSKPFTLAALAQKARKVLNQRLPTMDTPKPDSDSCYNTANWGVR